MNWKNETVNKLQCCRASHSSCPQAQPLRAKPDLDLNILSSGSDHADRHPLHFLIDTVICAILGSPHKRLTEIEIMIAIKRRFAYYANPHHDQGFWVSCVLFDSFANPTSLCGMHNCFRVFVA
ncbi:hypothetical protein JB92DRAFT_2937076 [Gautieria morchelliformis]|nr:hypothetical protein JB92DRAFT_2937076 [Gautieria morchelliformis]